MIIMNLIGVDIVAHVIQVILLVDHGNFSILM